MFIHLAESLQNGDVYVEGSEAYADYRAQLLPWSECQNRLTAYCQALELPNTGVELVTHLRAQLTRVAHQTDQRFPGDGELTLDPDGVPHVKRLPTRQAPEGLDDFKKTVRERMPNRHLLDILKNVQHWSHYTKHFVPPSGSSTKLSNPDSTYLFTVFGYGCNLGASQTASHSCGPQIFKPILSSRKLIVMMKMVWMPPPTLHIDGYMR